MSFLFNGLFDLNLLRGETYTRLPEVVRLVQFSLNLDECRDKDAQAELLQLMFYVVDKVRLIIQG